jgi:hypothetical protein
VQTVSDELTSMDATAMAELVRSGEASPLELVDAAIERIESVNDEINAVIHPLYEEAREAAAGDVPDGPFRGVPFLLKDLGARMRLGVEGSKFHVQALQRVKSVVGAFQTTGRVVHS